MKPKRSSRPAKGKSGRQRRPATQRSSPVGLPRPEGANKAGHSSPLYALAERVGKALKARNLMLVTAESCTGGWIAQAVTMVPGSSEWFERGYVTYTYISKREVLGVRDATLGAHGAVAEEVAREMAAGALERSHAQVAVAVSGVAGPGGGTPDKPVGTVCFAWAAKDGGSRAQTLHISGDRDAVRRKSVEHALKGVLALLAAR